MRCDSESNPRGRRNVCARGGPRFFFFFLFFLRGVAVLRGGCMLLHDPGFFLVQRVLLVPGFRLLRGFLLVRVAQRVPVEQYLGVEEVLRGEIGIRLGRRPEWCGDSGTGGTVLPAGSGVGQPAHCPYWEGAGDTGRRSHAGRDAAPDAGGPAGSAPATGPCGCADRNHPHLPPGVAFLFPTLPVHAPPSASSPPPKQRHPPLPQMCPHCGSTLNLEPFIGGIARGIEGSP